MKKITQDIKSEVNKVNEGFDNKKTEDKNHELSNSSGKDKFVRLKELGELKDSGVLTEEEF